uniref:Uncharacterized protein n=1 Tax=Anopheles atroparvus TaxID=41427 RepID=A0AAG5DSE5_ANOAO
MITNRKMTLPMVRYQHKIERDDENYNVSTGRKKALKVIKNVRRSTLLIHRHQDNIKRLHDSLFEVAIKYASTGHVLFFTIKKVERVSDSALSQFSDSFKNIVFFYIQSIDKLLEKLIDLQRWENCLPQMIIIESLDDMTNAEGVCQVSQHTSLMACLADTVKVISSKLESNCKCIVTMNDVTYNEIPFEMFARESCVLNEATLSGFTEIMSVLAEMT